MTLSNPRTGVQLAHSAGATAAGDHLLAPHRGADELARQARIALRRGSGPPVSQPRRADLYIGILLVAAGCGGGAGTGHWPRGDGSFTSDDGHPQEQVGPSNVDRGMDRMDTTDIAAIGVGDGASSDDAASVADARYEREGRRDP